MGEASASFGNSQNYDGEEGPSKSMVNSSNNNKPKKKSNNNKRGSKGPPPADDNEKGSSSNKRGSTPREPKYKCELCSFSTAYLYSINRHALKVHKDSVMQEDGSIKACFEKLETKKEPVTLPSLFTSPPSTSAPSQEFDGLQEFNNIVDSLGVSTSTQWSDPSNTAEQLGPIKFATTDGTQINIFRTDYVPFGQNDSHFITFEKADESSATVGDTLLNGYLGNTLQVAAPQEPKFLHLSTSSSLGNSSQHSQQQTLEVKTENDASNGPGKQKSNSLSPKKFGKSKKRKSSLGTSDSGNDDLSSDGKGGPEKKKRKQNAPISLIKSTVSKCPLCSFSSKYPSNTGRHFQSVHKAECKEVLEGRLTLEGIVKKEERVEKQQSPPKKKRPPAKKPVELKIPQIGAPSSQEYSDNNSSMASQNPPGPTPAEQLQQFVQNEHLELYAGPDTDNIEPIASFIDSLLSGCVGPNEWGLPPVEGAYPVETTHFVPNTGEAVAQSHNVMQLEPQLNGLTNSYLQQYSQVQQVQIQPQQLQQYQHPAPVSEAHPTPGYHPVPQIQSVTPVAPTTPTSKKTVKNNKPPAQTLSAEEQKQAALNRRREKRREQRLKKLAEKNSALQQQQQQQQQTSSTPVSQAAQSHAGISIDNPAAVVVPDPGVDNSLRNEVRAAVEGTYETLVSSHSLTSSQYHTSYGTGVDAPMSTPADNRVNSSGTNSLQPTTMNVQMGYQMASGMHSIMDTVQVAAVGAPVDTPAVTPAGTALPVATLEWSSQLYHPAPNQAIPVNDGSTAYTTLNVATMNISDVHTYLPIDFNELSQSTTTLQPLDPTIVITNSATSPNAPVLSIPQPVVPLSVDENSFFDASLRPTEIQQPQASTTHQQVFSDNSVNHQHSDSRNGDESSTNSVSPRIKTERTQHDIETAKQDRLAKRREKYRQQQELKKKGLQPPPTTDNKPQKKPVPPEVLEARRKRELERRKEKRKQLAEQKRLLQQQQKQLSQATSDGGQVLGSKSVPIITPGGVTSETRAPDLPSVSSSGSSVPSSTNTDTTLSSDNSGPGIMTPPEAQKVLCGESGALTTSGEMKKEAGSLGISDVVIVQEESSFLGSAVKEPNSMPGQVDQVRETIEDNLPQQFRRSTASELNSILSDDHQTSTAAASGVTTSDLKPVYGLEGSIVTNSFPIMDMEFQTDSEENAQLRGHSAALAPINFVPSQEQVLDSARRISQGREEEISQPSAEAKGTAHALDFFTFPSEVLQSSSDPVVSVTPSPWKPQLRDDQIPAANSLIFEQGWHVKPIAEVKMTEGALACIDGPILQSSSLYMNQFNSSGNSFDLPLSDARKSAAAIDIKPVMSEPPLKKSRGDLTPAEIEAKKMKKREKQREYSKMRRLKKRKELAKQFGEPAVKVESGMTSGDNKHQDDSRGPQESTSESLKEKKRLKIAAQQRERRRKSKEQKNDEHTAAAGTSNGAEGSEGEDKGKKIKFIKVDHSPQVQNCPDCDFQTDTHYKLMVHKTVHDALNNMPPFVKSIIDATGKVDYLLKYQPDRDPFEGTKVVLPTMEVRKDSV